MYYWVRILGGMFLFSAVEAFSWRFPIIAEEMLFPLLPLYFYVCWSDNLFHSRIDTTRWWLVIKFWCEHVELTAFWTQFSNYVFLLTQRVLLDISIHLTIINVFADEYSKLRFEWKASSFRSQFSKRKQSEFISLCEWFYLFQFCFNIAHDDCDLKPIMHCG